MPDSRRLEAVHALRFAGKVLAVLAALVLALWILAITFAFSKWAGFVALGFVAIALYASAHHWVRWLPGLLIFGVLNSVIGLITHQVPTNPNGTISTGLAALALTFYALGFVVSYCYDAAHLSVLDRCAFLVYLAGMVLPAALTLHSNPGIVTPSIAWPTITGMAALSVSFSIHRLRRGRSD